MCVAVRVAVRVAVCVALRDLGDAKDEVEFSACVLQ